MVTKAHKCARS